MGIFKLLFLSCTIYQKLYLCYFCFLTIYLSIYLPISYLYVFNLMPLDICAQIQKGNFRIKLQMYSNIFSALNCISKSFKERKTGDYYVESGNKRVFLSGNHEILIVDVIAISSAVFYELGEILLTLLCLSYSTVFTQHYYVFSSLLGNLPTYFFNLIFDL